MVLFVVKISASGVRRAFDYDFFFSIYTSNAVWKIPAIIEACRIFLKILLFLEKVYVVPVEQSIWHNLSL